jgi:FtsP/CotA-like multicopper oxidase with cupredoxin domain
MRVSRRALLLGVGAVGLRRSLPWSTAQATEVAKEFRLVAKPARLSLVGDGHQKTIVWAYNGSVPDPEIRVRQGDRIRIEVANELAEGTTILWHGLRIPNAMDGVPDLTQPLIMPGRSFIYEFDIPDAGTYWYHPHERSFEQVGRGMAGPLIVEERQPIRVDRDIAWVLDDWRLTDDAEIASDFGNMMDASHAGRLGNTVTINGAEPERAGERIRLRLINVANARIFGLEFECHQPQVVALDGQPVTEAHALPGGRLVLAPAQRADLVLDAAGRPGATFRVTDRFYPNQQYRLVDLAYSDEPPLRSSPFDAPVRLLANTQPEPDLATAVRHEIEFGGGMMDPKMMRGGGMGGMMERMRSGHVWTVNGVSVTGHVHEPFLTLERGRTCILAMLNDTAWHHPMHLHGHVFRVLSRNGQPTTGRAWRDTVLMAPGERADIAFVADNPGDWMFHCHILEHQAAGMMGVIRVA